MSPLRLAVVVGALGVVFGDIGTSPIYTIQTVFNPEDPHPVPVEHDNVLGVVSLIFWSVMLIVTITYVLLAMRVDNDGEGGIMALITLLRRWTRTQQAPPDGRAGRPGHLRSRAVPRRQHDHPCHLGPVRGRGAQGHRPRSRGLGRPHHCRHHRRAVRGPAVRDRGGRTPLRAGDDRLVPRHRRLRHLGHRHDPEILQAISPTYASGFLAGHFHLAFFALAAIVLAVTGAEALYADMGHFGRRPISVGWIFLVFPACALSYFGQGALILDDPANISRPFFLLAPDWARIPMVVLATAATVIASQAVITGAFSVASQAARLGYLPRLRILHTSRSTHGQIYVPWVNWLLLVSVLTLVFAFRSSAALAYAFGMAVTGTITITTILFFYVAFRTWRTPRWLLAIAAVPLLASTCFSSPRT